MINAACSSKDYILLQPKRLPPEKPLSLKSQNLYLEKELPMKATVIVILKFAQHSLECHQIVENHTLRTLMTKQQIYFKIIISWNGYNTGKWK
jgi:hypothetical protein